VEPHAGTELALFTATVLEDVSGLELEVLASIPGAVERHVQASTHRTVSAARVFLRQADVDLPVNRAVRVRTGDVQETQDDLGPRVPRHHLAHEQSQRLQWGRCCERGRDVPSGYRATGARLLHYQPRAVVRSRVVPLVLVDPARADRSSSRLGPALVDWNHVPHVQCGHELHLHSVSFEDLLGVKLGARDLVVVVTAL
jgi:hypothetical protein